MLPGQACMLPASPGEAGQLGLYACRRVTAHSQIQAKNVQKVHVLRFSIFFFPGSVWYWRLEISEKTRPLYAQCTVVFIEPEQTQLFSADFIR